MSSCFSANVMAEGFYELDEQTQEDLLAWYNVQEKYVDNRDRKILFDLFKKGQFTAWNCPECGERVYVADPDSWDNFQGTCGQDYVSFPGNGEKYTAEYLYQLCDGCRMSAG